MAMSRSSTLPGRASSPEQAVRLGVVDGQARPVGIVGDRLIGDGRNDVRLAGEHREQAVGAGDPLDLAAGFRPGDAAEPRAGLGVEPQHAVAVEQKQRITGTTMDERPGM